MCHDLCICLEALPYRSPKRQQMACTIKENGREMKHRHCKLHSSYQFVNCKNLCDSDPNCKGYSVEEGGCVIATSSSCQSGFSKHNYNSIGSLINESTLQGLESGCFIKEYGNRCHKKCNKYT